MEKPLFELCPELCPYNLTRTGLFFLYIFDSQKISLMSDVIKITKHFENSLVLCKTVLLTSSYPRCSYADTILFS